MIFALIGNQNCGKTTLFNQLTGSNQHVGNFPGVTVTQKTGEIRNNKTCSVVDLPGIYSIRTYTSEEFITRDFIINEKPDGIINIVDATNIERNLYLTLQLIEMRVPMVLALNMMDEVRNNGGTINTKEMSELLGIPVIPISAVKNEGIDELVSEMIRVSENKIYPKRMDFCEYGALHRCMHTISRLVEDHAKNANIALRFATTKLIEGDKNMVDKLYLSQNELDSIQRCIAEMETKCQMDRNSALADMRYSFIERVCKKTVVKCRDSKEYIRSVKIDKVLTDKYLAIPLFICIIFIIFFLTFNVIGSYLSELMGAGIEQLSEVTDSILTMCGTNEVIRRLIIDGIFSGVGSVISFLPIILILFFFLSILEDTGYMARVAFVTDKLLRKIGLSGKSIVPMLIGFGCSVPAVMATRTLSSERDRKLTIILIPFMSCSAKIPIYSIFATAFFPKYATLVMICLYVTGIAIGIITALLLKSTVFDGDCIPFVMELPNYRFPSLRTVLTLMWDKAEDFLQKAFTIIFLSSIVIWFLQTFDTSMAITTNSSDSILAQIGKFISPLFSPIGFGDWRIPTSLIAGFTAKEAVVSTMSVLMGTSASSLSSALSDVFTPLSAISFLVFTLLYTPCVAAITTIKNELNSIVKSIGIAILQCLIAWITAFIIYNIGSMLL